MKIKKGMVYLVLLCFFVNFSGCATLDSVNPQSLKSNHARARFVNVTYNLAYQDYQRFAALENLKPEARELLKVKRTVLINMHLPIAVLNGHAEAGTITDAMFNALLDKLMELEMGWYVATEQGESPSATVDKVRTFQLNPEVKNDHLRRAAIEAGLAQGDIKTTKTVSPVVIGALLELLRVGIHAVRAMLTQRNLDEAQMAVAWQESWDTFKTLNPNTLVEL